MTTESIPAATGRRRRSLRRLGYGAGIGAAAAVLCGVLALAPFMRVAEAKSWDARVQLTADPADAHPDIVFVDIDSNSLEAMRDELGRWPWSRGVHGAMLDYLHADSARAVVFDVTFPEADLLDPVADADFAASLADYGRAVLALTFSPGAVQDAVALESRRSVEDPELGRALALLERFALDSDGTVPAASLPYVEPPVAILLEPAGGVGSVNLNADPDGVVRWERLVYDRRGALYPSLALATARMLEPERFGGPVSFADGVLRVGPTEIPVADDGRMLLRWRGSYRRGEATTYPVIPAVAVLNSLVQEATGLPTDLPRGTFAGKIVFIGVTGTGTFDFDSRPTPVSDVNPGVMIHATALDDLISGEPARRAGLGANLALLGLTGVAAGAVTAGLSSATMGAAAFAALLAALLLGSTLAVGQGLWLDLVAPGLAGSLAFAGAMAANYMTEGRDKRRVRDLFSRYVAPEYVSRLADDHESLALGGERTEITILFSDIRGFTSLSERLPAPQVIEILNEYLERMADVVFRHGGTLDKFIGDAVMAFWGAPVAAPDHARRALDAALDMTRELEVLNVRWAERGAPAQLAIGIGINTGEAVVGNIGSLTRKLDYTAIGDAVNLASRLESLNKEFGTTILASESTARHAGHGYRFRPVEAVTVKGKTQAVNVLELMGRAADTPAPPAAGIGSATRALVLLALVAGALAGASPAAAQTPAKARWSDWVYRPGRWVAGRLQPASTTNQATDSLALVARVEAYSQPPRWRLELARTTDGTALAAPIVIIGGGAEPVVLTEVGSTPLSRHAAGQDSVVRQLVAGFGANGRPARAAPARIVETGAGGRVTFVVLRRAVARADFADNLLSAGAGGRLGRSLGRFGVQSLGGERRTDVVASAGARGVARVRTVDGEIVVQPDTAAVLAMERVTVDLAELDRFLRELQSAPAGGGR